MYCCVVRFFVFFSSSSFLPCPIFDRAGEAFFFPFESKVSGSCLLVSPSFLVGFDSPFEAIWPSRHFLPFLFFRPARKPPSSDPSLPPSLSILPFSPIQEKRGEERSESERKRGKKTSQQQQNRKVKKSALAASSTLQCSLARPPSSFVRFLLRFSFFFFFFRFSSSLFFSLNPLLHFVCCSFRLS